MDILIMLELTWIVLVMHVLIHDVIVIITTAVVIVVVVVVIIIIVILIINSLIMLIVWAEMITISKRITVNISIFMLIVMPIWSIQVCLSHLDR